MEGVGRGKGGMEFRYRKGKAGVTGKVGGEGRDGCLAV